MRELNDVDKQILKIARKLFIEHGIVDTEMKDIATKLGTSRSTLYRHFASKNDILMLLAQEAISGIMYAVRIPDGARFKNGFEMLAWQIRQLTEILITHVEDVIFLRDFDFLFSKEYPETSETSSFLQQIYGVDIEGGFRDTIIKGIVDKSIRPIDNVDLMTLTIAHGCIALAQRILPREELFIKEHGYGQEIIRNYAESMLDLLKNDSAGK